MEVESSNQQVIEIPDSSVRDPEVPVKVAPIPQPVPVAEEKLIKTGHQAPRQAVTSRSRSREKDSRGRSLEDDSY